MKTNFETDIFQQPDLLRQIIQSNIDQVKDIAKELCSRKPHFALIAARGTSDNAATYAKYLLSAFIRIPVGLAMPSLYTLYECPPSMKGGVVIGISQSGQTPDIVRVLQESREQGALTLSITNDPHSPMSKNADHSIVLNVGEEKSVPASKTYTAQLAVISMLSAYWSSDRKLIEELGYLGDMAEEVLNQNQKINKIAGKFADKNFLVVIGRGFNYCTTSEIALKIKELCYMVAEAYSSADFRHGPVAILEEGFPVLAIAPKGKAFQDMVNMVAEIMPLKTDLAILSNNEALLSQTDMPIGLPSNLPEWLSPIIATIPGQLLALHLCLLKGYDPDHPRGLKKVTLTY